MGLAAMLWAGPGRAETFEKMIGWAGPGREILKMRWAEPGRGPSYKKIDGPGRAGPPASALDKP